MKTAMFIIVTMFAVAVCANPQGQIDQTGKFYHNSDYTVVCDDKYKNEFIDTLTKQQATYRDMRSNGWQSISVNLVRDSGYDTEIFGNCVVQYNK